MNEDREEDVALAKRFVEMHRGNLIDSTWEVSPP